MKRRIKSSLIICVILSSCYACNSVDAQDEIKSNALKENNIIQNEFNINQSGKTIRERYRIPDEFKRESLDTNSFGFFLRNLELKPYGSHVLFYNGQKKLNYNVYSSVVNLPIGNKNLHQCADAIMRLRADYLRSIGKSDEIHFNFTNGFRADFETWKKGNKISVHGNKVSWYKANHKGKKDQIYWNYLERVFMFAGTLSLSKELNQVPIEEMKIGDVFIQGGSPGHAVIIVDMIESSFTGEKMFLLAQSYMPAQEIHILLNPNNDNTGWYKLDDRLEYITPEWTFTKFDLKRF